MKIPKAVKPLAAHLDNLLAAPCFASYPPILGIDGKCGAGKTTLAAFLGTLYDTYTIHMDDFFLPPSLRTQKRLNEPGGNIHYERLLDEVILPLSRHEQFIIWKKFDCSRMDYADSRTIQPKAGQPILLEGSYSLRPEFCHIYAMTVFVDVDDALQKERIRLRSGADALSVFTSRWIPMENRYFSYYRIQESCNLVLTLDNLPQR